MILALQESERTTFEGRHYRLDDAPLEPKPLQQPHIPLLIAAHRPRMIRLAARYADQWDTFPEIPGTATDGVTTSVAERVDAFERAGRDAGRDPATIRRSTWAGSEVAESEIAFVEVVQRHRALGFTDIAVEWPERAGLDALRRIARDRIPALRDASPGRGTMTGHGSSHLPPTQEEPR